MASIARSALLRQSAAAASRFAPARSVPSAVFKLQQQQQQAKQLLQNTSRIAAFHASSRRSLLPPPPQVIQGTVNDAAPIPAPNPSHGHYMWSFERLIAAGLVPLTVAPFAAGSLNPTLDAILCATVLIHSHLGFQVIITDYVPKKHHPTLRTICTWSLNLVTALVGLGLYEFETNDVGLTELISKLWKA